MIKIEDSDVVIRNGAYFVDCYPDSSVLRVTVMTYDPKGVIRKYKKMGRGLCKSSPMMYQDGLFYKLRRDLEVCTRRGLPIAIGNAMYHIQRSFDNGLLKVN